MKYLINRLGIIALLAISFNLINLGFLCGCKKDNTNPPDSNQIKITKTGCKSHIFTTDSFKLDCIEYQFQNNILHIKHINAAFNCCPTKVYSTAIISHDSLLITEKEILSQPCDCNCLYDLEYDVPCNIIDSTFVIVINEPYVTDDADKIIFHISPAASQIGTFCKPRSMYPWN